MKKCYNVEKKYLKMHVSSVLFKNVTVIKKKKKKAGIFAVYKAKDFYSINKIEYVIIEREKD